MNDALLENLNGVHPHLEALVRRAIEIVPYEVAVAVGKRSQKEQDTLAKGGRVSSSSRHVPMPGGNGFSHAVELDILLDWDENGNNHAIAYRELALAFKKASQELDIPFDWGGDRKTDKDTSYFQLPTRGYPLDGPVRPLSVEPAPEPSDPPKKPVWDEIDPLVDEINNESSGSDAGSAESEESEEPENNDSVVFEDDLDAELDSVDASFEVIEDDEFEDDSDDEDKDLYVPGK